jgi:hypothetical protein
MNDMIFRYKWFVLGYKSYVPDVICLLDGNGKHFCIPLPDAAFRPEYPSQLKSR